MGLKKLAGGIFGGSIILLITINLFNAINYLFHFAMARILSLSDYGVLVALMSILYIFNVSTESIQTIVTRYVSKESSPGKIKYIVLKFLKKSFNISLILFVLYLIIAVPLSIAMRIPYPVMALLGTLLITSFILPSTRGALQGNKRFKALGTNMILEALIKISVSILLVFAGWRVYGAVAGLLIGAVASFALSFISLRDIFKSKENKTSTKGVYGYSLPVFVVTTVITIFYSIDTILAKIFFVDEIAGEYAIASILAKIIFFGTIPITKAMFSISASNSSKGKSSKNIFIKSMLIMGACIAVALIIIYLFPELMVRIFSGKVHLFSSSILFYLAVALSLASFTNLILFYKLSLGKLKNYFAVLIFLVFEIGLLWCFHANLMQYSITLIFLNLLFLFGSIFLFNRK